MPSFNTINFEMHQQPKSLYINNIKNKSIKLKKEHNIVLYKLLKNKFYDLIRKRVTFKHFPKTYRGDVNSERFDEFIKKNVKNNKR